MQVMKAVREGTHVTCPRGAEKSYQIGAAVVQSLDAGLVGADGAVSAAARFAEELGARWGVGDAGCDNGVLLFISIGDRVAYIKTAPQSRKLITDEVSTLIVDSMKPLLRAQRYGDAMRQAVQQLRRALDGGAVSSQRAEVQMKPMPITVLPLEPATPPEPSLQKLATMLTCVVFWPMFGLGIVSVLYRAVLAGYLNPQKAPLRSYFDYLPQHQSSSDCGSGSSASFNGFGGGAGFSLGGGGGASW